MFAYASAPSAPALPGGIVSWMKDSSSRAARAPHAPMNAVPASGVAVPCPARSGWWQLAQLA